MKLDALLKNLLSNLEELNSLDELACECEKCASNKDDEAKESCYFIVRTNRAGVFYGKIAELNDVTRKVVMGDARRVWYWEGAASLSQMAIDGVSKPEECKFPEALPTVVLYEVIEIIPLSPKAKKSLDSVPVWKA